MWDFLTHTWTIPNTLVIGCHVLKGFKNKLLHPFVQVIDPFVKELEHPISALL